MPFVPLVTTENEGPHLIVVGKGIVIDDDTIVFSVATSRNIENNGISQIVVVSETRDMGYRLAATGHIEKEGAISDRLRGISSKQLGRLNFVTVMKMEWI